jgi:hypothetical protein
MKQFAVDVDITMSKRIYVDAESEEQAEQIAKQKLDNNPYDYCLQPDACVDYNITDVNEYEDDSESGVVGSEDLEAALDYVRKEMDSDDLAIIRAKVSKNMKERCSAWYGVDYAKVEELLYEYGEAHDLIDEDADEEWWEEYGDIDDILLKL